MFSSIWHEPEINFILPFLNNTIGITNYFFNDNNFNTIFLQVLQAIESLGYAFPLWRGENKFPQTKHNFSISGKHSFDWFS
jgi:hypothetical protein